MAARPVLSIRKTGLFLLWTGAAALVLVTIFAFLGKGWWYGDLFSHFRFHYLTAAALALPLAGALRAWRLTAFFLLIAILHIVPILHPYRGQAGRETASPGEHIRVATVNVEWKNNQFDAVTNYLRRVAPDVIVIQEAGPRWHPTVARLAAGFPYIAPANWRTEQQNILLSRYPISSAEVRRPGPFSSNFLMARLRIRETAVTVRAVHPPTPINRRLAVIHRGHFAAFRTEVTGAPGPVIVAGDFNLTPWSRRFRAFMAATALSIADHGLIWPRTFPARSRFRLPGGFIPGIPIDHVLVSSHFTITRVRRGPYVGSDHDPLVVDLSLAPAPRR